MAADDDTNDETDDETDDEDAAESYSGLDEATAARCGLWLDEE